MRLALWMLLLSMVPGIEARGSSVYFFCSNQLMFIPIAVLINFAGVMLFLKLLNMERVPAKIERFLESRTGKLSRRIEKWFERYGKFALFFLIALPSTGIGSYTGAFIGRVFGLDGKKFYACLFGGILFSIILSFLLGYIISTLGICCPQNYLI